MRSRYSAYALGNGAYLVATNQRAPRPGEAAELEAWSRSVGWCGLEVRATERGSAADDTGVVHFVARYVEQCRLVRLEERSAFVRGEGCWQYVEGQASVSREKLERNAPCPCGSGKKVKACHG